MRSSTTQKNLSPKVQPLPWDDSRMHREAWKSAGIVEVSPVVSASDRDPLASDLGPSSFISRALSSRVSFPGLRRVDLLWYGLGRSVITPKIIGPFSYCLDGVLYSG